MEAKKGTLDELLVLNQDFKRANLYNYSKIWFHANTETLDF